MLIISCTNESYQDLTETKTLLNLKWNKAYNDDTIEKSAIGLQWALSYIGAKLPRQLSGIRVNNDNIFIDIEKLGFSETAKQKLMLLHDMIKASNEYQTTNTIDLGRYVTLLIGASEHYYALTEVPLQLSSILSKYSLKEDRGYINNSSVSLEHRVISFSGQNGLNQFFLSTETEPTSGAILEYETIEFLPNGQLRFGVFDHNGNRKNNADPIHSKAGKPAKCIWCHESNIQPLFNEQDDFNGFLPFLDFKDTLIVFRNSHIELKNALNDGVDYSQNQQHTLTELIYISFMEPSAERLSLEWGMSIAEIESKLSGLETHVHEEFSFLGNLYDREDIKIHAPFKGLQVSTKVREQSEIEVNHIN